MRMGVRPARLMLVAVSLLALTGETYCRRQRPRSDATMGTAAPPPLLGAAPPPASGPSPHRLTVGAELRARLAAAGDPASPAASPPCEARAYDPLKAAARVASAEGRVGDALRCRERAAAIHPSQPHGAQPLHSFPQHRRGHMRRATAQAAGHASGRLHGRLLTRRGAHPRRPQPGPH
eukprot:SAG11_NODE_5123_length_1657_cov_6.820282_2_plen_178_part_00